MRPVFLAVPTLLIASTLSAGMHAPAERPRRLVDQSYLCTSTLNEMRSVRLALRDYALDHHGALPADTSIDDVKALIEPVYIRKATVVDAWGRPFSLVVSPDGTSFTLASAGSDGAFDRDSWSEPGLLSSSKEDAVLASEPGRDREWVIQE